MRRAFFVFFPLVGFVIIVLFSCQKPPDTPSPNPPNADSTSQFSFDCSSIKISGEFIKDKSLTSNDTLTVNVNVIKTGYGKFFTDTVNGIIFSSDINLTKLGFQTIKLKGAGIPEKEGTYSFVLKSKNGDCNFSLLVGAINMQKYIDRVRHPIGTSYTDFTYNGKNQIVALLPSQYVFHRPRYFSYDQNQRLTESRHGDYTGDHIDSFIYSSESKVHTIVTKKILNNPSRLEIEKIDTLIYNPLGLLASRIMKEPRTDLPPGAPKEWRFLRRVDFKYDTDSNLTEAIQYEYSQNQFVPVKKNIYLQYDKKINPLRNIGGINLYFMLILFYSRNNMDIYNFSQLSKNNPAKIYEYVLDYYNRWYLDAWQDLTYTYDSEGFPVDVHNIINDHVIQYLYKKR